MSSAASDINAHTNQKVDQCYITDSAQCEQ